MMKPPTILEIKGLLEDHVGTRVRLTTNKGRKKFKISHGVIKHTYPSLFVVEVDDGQVERTVSYSYADVLTKTVVVTIDETQTNILS